MAANGSDSVRDERMARLDSAVSEVFEMMLDLSCAPLETEFDIEERITARIRFSGVIAGECLVYASPTVAQITAAALLGTVSESYDPMVDDAVGELCNMIAGGWKSKLQSSQAACLISVPHVARGGALEFDHEFGTTYRRFYAFEGNVFGVSLAF